MRRKKAACLFAVLCTAVFLCGNVLAVDTVRVDTTLPDAQIVKATKANQVTYTVVENGTVVLPAEMQGAVLTATEKNVSGSLLDGNLESTSVDSDAYGTLPNGTAMLLARFAEQPMAAGKLQATWKAFNYYAGYPTVDSQQASDYQNAYDASHVKKLLVEDRDPVTGKLRGSFLVDGSQWTYATGADKGPYYMNYLLDPSNTYMTAGYALQNHYSYSANAEGGSARLTQAEKELTAVRNSTTSALFFLYRMRDFAGPITFRIDVSESGKFLPGDKVSIRYLLGAADRNLYHGVKPDASKLLVLEKTYAKYYQDSGMTTVVDDDGYLSFTLHNGGYFELRNETSIAEGRKVTVKQAANEPVALKDMGSSHWAYSAVQKMVSGHYMEAADGAFLPDSPITRADYVRGLVLASGMTLRSGKTAFADVPAAYSDYIFTAVQNGITTGVSDLSFEPNGNVTREMTAVMLCRAFNFTAADSDGVTDAASVSSWAKGTIGACVEKGWITGYGDGSFSPQKTITRAEAASLLTRVVESR